jgi:hypothetical protein
LRLPHQNDFGHVVNRCETCLSVTKCHTCHAKRGYGTFESSKNSPQARPYGPHTDTCERLRTIANSCKRKRNVERTHPQPRTP